MRCVMYCNWHSFVVKFEMSACIVGRMETWTKLENKVLATIPIQGIRIEHINSNSQSALEIFKFEESIDLVGPHLSCQD